MTTANEIIFLILSTLKQLFVGQLSFYFKQREEVKKGKKKLCFKDEGGKIT